MKYTNNAIYTRIRNAAVECVSTCNCTQTYTPTQAKFPTVFAREIGRLTPNGTPTLSNAQDISERSWEVQIFSNIKPGAKEQAYELMDAVKGALRELYFVEYFESPLDQQDKNIYCLVARFRRIIGSGEEMPSTIVSA